MMFRLNTSKGLGDAICMRAVAFHLVCRGESVEVFTPWPEVFRDLRVTVRPQSAIDDDAELRHVAPCVCRIEHVQALDYFTNACQRAGVPDAPLAMGWGVTNRGLVADIRRRAAGRTILVYQPVKRAHSPDQALVRPRREAFNARVADMGDCYRIKIGNPAFVPDDPDAACELDLFGRTTVAEAFDVVSAADRVFSEPCFLVLAAQAMDKPTVCMFSRRALASGNHRVSNIRPRRIFNKPHLCTAVWDEPEAALLG